MIDLQALLKPISDDAPSGPDLRFEAASNVLQTVKDKRQSLDPALDPEGRGREADWQAVVRECNVALTEKTKDLELVAYLIEGLTWQSGLAGMKPGLELLYHLLESQWDSIHPGIDEEGVTDGMRTRWVSWLAASDFLRALKAAPLNRLDAEEDSQKPDRAPAISWLDYDHAEILDDQTLSEERRAELLEAGYKNMSQWTSGVAAISVPVLKSVTECLDECTNLMRGIESFCEEKVADPDDRPSTYALTSELEKMHEYLVARIPAEIEGGGETQGENASNGDGGGGGGPRVLNTRDAALQQLREVGDYFRRTEPHSPIAHLIARAIRWGGMSFEELVRDLARNDDVISHIWETLGLDKPTDESGE